MTLRLAAAWLAAVACAAAQVGRPAPSPRAAALDLIVLGGGKADRLELRVDLDGKPVTEAWDDAFAGLFAYFDRDGDGSLDKSEAGRLPSAFAVRQVLWGRFALSADDAPPFADLDLNGDGGVGREELADYYRRAGLGGVLVGVGKPPATDRLTEALLRHLDADRDGTVSEAEWKAAAATLHELDRNDDELIGPGELAEQVSYPGATGSILLAAPAPGGKPDATIDRLPLLVLPLRTADTHWGKAAARRVGEAATPADAEKLLSLRKAAPAVAWAARLDAGKAAVWPAGGKPPADARLDHTAGRTRLVLRADEGRLAEQTALLRKRYTALFGECDADADGALSGKELERPQGRPFRQVLAAADRDGDGRLSEREFAAWLALQERIARGHVLLTVLDQGAGLFELLDADHDGGLSVRELRTAWDRLKAAGCVRDGRLDRERLPRHLLAAVSRGLPRVQLGVPVRAGPDWFRAMDRNGDGDVSRREFIGPKEAFDKLDADGDGLISAAEASRR